MNKRGIIISILLFVAIQISFSVNIKLVKINGSVQIKKSSASNWIVPKTGDVLDPGAVIFTGFGSTADIMAEDSLITVQPLTQVTISSLYKTEKKVDTDLKLDYGKITADVKSKENLKTVFKVQSANSTASVRGTVFTFGDDVLIVNRGTVNLKNKNGFSTLVQQNERAEAPKLQPIKLPHNITFADGVVHGGPLGVSMDELNSFAGFIQGKATGRANAVINITVINRPNN